MNVNDDIPVPFNSDYEKKRKLEIGRLSRGYWLEGQTPSGLARPLEKLGYDLCSPGAMVFSAYHSKQTTGTTFLSKLQLRGDSVPGCALISVFEGGTEIVHQ